MHDKLYLKAWKRLPERFRKQTNKDLYYVLYGDFDEVEQGFLDIKDSRNIDNAIGETLDRMGANVGQFRQGEDDDLYRQLIKVRIIANMSIGDIPTINLVMSTLVKEIYLGLQEVWNFEELKNEPAAIILKLSVLHKNTPYFLINAIKAAGVRVLFNTFAKHKIYYGMYAQKLKKHTIFPAKPQDKNIDLNVYFGGTVARKKVIRKLRVINIFIEENNKRYEVTGPGGEILDYER